MKLHFMGAQFPINSIRPIDIINICLQAKFLKMNWKQKLSQADIHGVLDLPAEYTITAIQGKQTIDALERLKDETIYTDFFLSLSPCANNSFRTLCFNV